MVFRRARRDAGPTSSAGVRPAVPVADMERTSSGGPIWSDRLGRWAIRSLQVVLVLTLAAIAVWALVQVKLLVIPVLVAN